MWIIGASTGIGRALAHRLASQSRTLAVSARSAERLGTLAQEHPNMVSHTLDVTDQEQVAQAAKRLDMDHGTPDLVIISSGVWHPVKPDAFDPLIFRNAVDVNFLGVINVLAAIVPKMIKRGSGHIAIIASVSGYRGLPNAAAYSPMKAALINLAESIYPQLKRQGVDITIINPGFVDTPMTSVNKFPMPFLMTPEEAAKRISKGLDRRDYEIAFPTRFALFLKLLRMLPNRVFFWIINKFVLK
ncbi:MAG: SDR family NAD(P)-dependent oxidoreductase [Rhizobiaceae bacterium]